MLLQNVLNLFHKVENEQKFHTSLWALKKKNETTIVVQKNIKLIVPAIPKPPFSRLHFALPKSLTIIEHQLQSSNLAIGTKLGRKIGDLSSDFIKVEKNLPFLTDLQTISNFVSNFTAMLVWEILVLARLFRDLQPWNLYITVKI